MNGNGYVLHLPKEESVVLPGPVARRLVEAGDGDAALVYIAILRSSGSIDESALLTQLQWTAQRLRMALDRLAAQGLIARPQSESGPPAPASVPEPPERRIEYTRADMAQAMEGAEFSSLSKAVEERLGKKLTTPGLEILLGLYDHLGLPADVIFLLVNFCAERTAAQYGEGRIPTMRQIEKEGYLWAREGFLNQESASAYIRKYQRSREALPQLMRLLRLDDRRPSPSEEKYLLSWVDKGFDNGAIEKAYDQTILYCKELKWAYMNKILCNWDKQGLHTLKAINANERPAPPRRNRRTPTPSQDAGRAAREDLARMDKYLEHMRSGKGDS